MTDGTDGWDERTEAMPGAKDDKSFELDMDFASESSQPEATQQLSLPSLVVFEPVGLGLAKALAGMGYDVRAGATGVDVMAFVAEQPPAAVVCAPAPDAERRRLLAAALRLRFPHVPVLYVSTHAGQEEAVLGAIREGARAVIAWPLPPVADVRRVLAPYVDVAAAPSVDDEAVVTPARPVPRPATLPEATAPQRRATGRSPLPPASLDEDFDEAETVVTPSRARPPHQPQPVALPTPPSARVPTHPRPAPPLLGPEEPNTQPNMRPAPAVAVEAVQEKRGEIGQLLAAVSPFLWSLEDAARWADELAASGDDNARNHARALHLLARILAQLQARIDESGL